MTSQNSDDGDYPYSARPASAMAVRPGIRLRNRIPWKFVGAIVRRLAFTIAAAIPAGIIAFAIVVVRARSQAKIVDQLAERKCVVFYYHQRDDAVDRVPGFLRKLLGDDFWNDVEFVGSRTETAEDAATIAALCGKLPKLIGFKIGNPHFSFELISNWPHLDNLEDLGIHSPRLTDADLVRIARIRDLRDLYLNSPNVSDVGLSQISLLSQLETLNIISLRFTGAAPRNTAGFPRLKELQISDSTDLADRDILNLGHMPELEKVVIRDAQIGDATLAHLSTGAKLYEVELNPCQVTDDGFASLEKCVDLNHLELVGAPVSDNALKVLVGKPFFSITLNHSRITDQGFISLSMIRDLRILELKDSQVTGATATSFRGHTKDGDADVYEVYEPLDFLILAGSPITPEGFIALANTEFLKRAYSERTSLNLSHTPMVDSDLLAFVANEDIGHFDITKTKVTSEGVKNFREARQRWLDKKGLEEKMSVVSDFESDESTQPSPTSPNSEEG